MNTENSDKKIMFITLGTGPGITHGILFSIKKQNPDNIVFIISNESQRTYEDIVSKFPDKAAEITKEVCAEVNDLQVIYKCYTEIINKYIRKGFLKENMVVDYTSGTKAMSAAIVSVAIAKGLQEFSYIAGDRDSSGRVISATEKVNLLTVNRIITENYLKIFTQFFNKGQFDLALGILDEIKEVHPDLQEKQELYRSLAGAFSSWEKFNFKGSFNLLDAIDLETRRKYGLKSRIDALKAMLYKLNEDNINLEKVYELIRNAQRRADEGKYDDAVARLYRSIEMIGQIEFYKEFGKETKSVVPKEFSDEIKNYLIKRHRCDENKNLQIGLKETFILLFKNGNRAGKRYFDYEEEFELQLNKRNYSILAHGNNPLDEHDFNKFLKTVTSFIDSVPEFNFPRIEV